jgi:peptidoglycan L-alanyl-D-glutamate endopeptidase CwlK
MNYYSNLHPEFLARLKVFEKELLKRNIRAEPTEGYRSKERQASLYAIGRTKPGRKVTNAKPGQTPHNYGLAMDYVPFVGHRTFFVKAAWWTKLGQAAKAAGLQWGGYWRAFKDRPHVEMPNWKRYAQ